MKKVTISIYETYALSLLETLENMKKRSEESYDDPYADTFGGDLEVLLYELRGALGEQIEKGTK